MGHPGGSIKEFDGGRGQGKREERSGIGSINRRETVYPIWSVFHVSGAEGRQYFTGV